MLNISNRKDLRNDEKQNIINLLSDEMSILEISQELRRDQRKIKRSLKNLTEHDGKGFKNLAPRWDVI